LGWGLLGIDLVGSEADVEFCGFVLIGAFGDRLCVAVLEPTAVTAEFGPDRTCYLVQAGHSLSGDRELREGA
jgi:hypothetical protein